MLIYPFEEPHLCITGSLKNTIRLPGVDQIFKSVRPNPVKGNFNWQINHPVIFFRKCKPDGSILLQCGFNPIDIISLRVFPLKQKYMTTQNIAKLALVHQLSRHFTIVWFRQLVSCQRHRNIYLIIPRNGWDNIKSHFSL